MKAQVWTGEVEGALVAEKVEVVVLVKAAPVLTSKLEESMCVAGIRIDGGRHDWIRLHPIPFRDLENDLRFAKYQRVEVDVIRPISDRRPESWRPIHGSIKLLESYSTANGWAQRRNLVRQLGERTMCELVAANQSGSGVGVPSLAMIRPVGVPRLVISERDTEQLETWERRADAAFGTRSLFDNPQESKPKLEVVPWRFSYQYQCMAESCQGHKQTIVDWEVVNLWRKVRNTPTWMEKMRKKFEEELWLNRDTVLFVGNQEQHPTAFLVLGVFWPPKGEAQGVFDV